MEQQQQRILDLTNQILERTLEYVTRHGTFTDVEDVDGRGGTKTQRLSNVTGLGEIRLIRSTIRKELGLDVGTLPGNNTANQTGTVPGSIALLSLIQSGRINLDQIQTLGTKDE
jgi:hypothetical protein